jgi:hypothetical protein
MNRKTKINQETATRILRTVPINNAFMFFKDITEYTGEYTRSLSDFCDKIESIPIASIAFHFERGDFKKWIEDTLGDEYLAGEFTKINRSSKEEKLRKSIQKVTRKRFNQLKRYSG